MRNHPGRKPTATRARRRDERGIEAPALIIVLPMLVVLVFALIDVGFSLRTRMLVENVARDAARGVAADGGNNNPRTRADNLPEGGWTQVAMNQMWSGGKCTFGACTKKPEVTCTPAIVNKSGDMVTCRINYYPKAINRSLLASPLGLGMDALIPETIDVDAYARAETGSNG